MGTTQNDRQPRVRWGTVAPLTSTATPPPPPNHYAHLVTLVSSVPTRTWGLGGGKGVKWEKRAFAWAQTARVPSPFPSRAASSLLAQSQAAHLAVM